MTGTSRDLTRVPGDIGDDMSSLSSPSVFPDLYYVLPDVPVVPDVIPVVPNVFPSLPDLPNVIPKDIGDDGDNMSSPMSLGVFPDLYYVLPNVPDIPVVPDVIPVVPNVFPSLPDLPNVIPKDIGDDGDDMSSPTSPGTLARSRDVPVIPDDVPSEISTPKTSHLKSIAVIQLC